jgi:predicted ArsR family transcriptional regulator
MIRDTLELLRAGINSVTDMADQLGVGVEDVRQRLRILEDKGLIQKMMDQGGCASRCPGCRHSGCGQAQGCQSSTYVLTEKGKRAMEKG